MPFTIKEFRDLIRLLEEHPEWRAELRRHLLPDELLELPSLVRQLAEAQARASERLDRLEATVQGLIEAQARASERLDRLEAAVQQLAEQVRALAEAQARTEERLDRLEAAVQQLAEAQARTEARVEQLAEAQARTEARVEQLAEAQARTEARVEQLAEAQARTEARVQKLSKDLSDFRQEFGDFRSKVLGRDLERLYRERADSFFGRLLRRIRVQRPGEVVEAYEAHLTPEDVQVLLQADLIVRGQSRDAPQQEEVWLVGEVSAKVDRNDVERAVRRAQALREAGLRAIPLVAGETATEGALKRVQEVRVVVLRDGTIAGWGAALSAWPPPSKNGR
jgi:chromosome segregation ATPase